MLSRLQNMQQDCDIYKNEFKPENKVLMLMCAL